VIVMGSDLEFKEALHFCGPDGSLAVTCTVREVYVPFVPQAVPSAAECVSGGDYDGDFVTLRVSVGGNASADVRCVVGASFAEAFGQFGDLAHMDVTYVDDEGDVIVMGSDLEFEEALHFCGPDGSLAVTCTVREGGAAGRRDSRFKLFTPDEGPASPTPAAGPAALRHGLPSRPMAAAELLALASGQVQPPPHPHDFAPRPMQ
jgi:hypothetical protein